MVEVSINPSDFHEFIPDLLSTIRNNCIFLDGRFVHTCFQSCQELTVLAINKYNRKK